MKINLQTKNVRKRCTILDLRKKNLKLFRYHHTNHSKYDDVIHVKSQKSVKKVYNGTIYQYFVSQNRVLAHRTIDGADVWMVKSWHSVNLTYWSHTQSQGSSVNSTREYHMDVRGITKQTQEQQSAEVTRRTTKGKHSGWLPPPAVS